MLLAKYLLLPKDLKQPRVPYSLKYQQSEGPKTMGSIFIQEAMELNHLSPLIIPSAHTANSVKVRKIAKQGLARKKKRSSWGSS